MNIKATILSLISGVLGCTCAFAQEAGVDAKGITVRVEGAIQLPSIYTLPVGETLTDAIDIAGGIKGTLGSEEGMTSYRVHVLRGGKVLVVDIRKIKAHKLKNFVLQDKDTIQVFTLLS